MSSSCESDGGLRSSGRRGLGLEPGRRAAKKSASRCGGLMGPHEMVARLIRPDALTSNHTTRTLINEATASQRARIGHAGTCPCDAVGRCRSRKDASGPKKHIHSSEWGCDRGPSSTTRKRKSVGIQESERAQGNVVLAAKPRRVCWLVGCLG